MLNAIKPFAETIVFVSNGNLSISSKNELGSVVSHIIERENRGFDVWAYKEALEYITPQELQKYDELLMMNHTIMGPVFPFSEVFTEMERRDIDFWGLTAYHELPDFRVKKCRYGHIPYHIQSHFIAVRKKMFSSDAFREYWNKLPKISSYQDSVYLHEAVFTKHFADLGYKFSVFADPQDLREHNLCPIIYSPTRLLRETRCPVFKRRTFFHDTADLQTFSMCGQAKELMDFLRSETDFDTSLILENILRTSSLADVQRCMGTFVFPDENTNANDEPTPATALVLHLYYDDMTEFCRKYAESMPQGSDLYITTADPEKAQRIKTEFSGGRWKNVNVILAENRGRDISSLLVGVREQVKKYDLVCFAHDKKSHSGVGEIVGEEFATHCFDNVLGSPEYVEAIIGEFRRQPRLGLLSAPPPYHSGYTQVIGNEWTCNFDATAKLAEALHIHVPINRDELPAAPLGTIFWFRPAALAPLLDRQWKYEDFPPEPNGDDGTMLHAIERLYPFAAQEAGYYSMWCLRRHNAERYLTTIYSMLQKEVFTRKKGKIRSFLFVRIKDSVKKRMPPDKWERLKKCIKKFIR